MYDMSPDLDMSTEWEDSSGEIQDIDIPINLDFFFLTPEDRPFIHDEIWNLVYHGQGGFDYTSVYNMEHGCVNII